MSTLIIPNVIADNDSDNEQAVHFSNAQSDSESSPSDSEDTKLTNIPQPSLDHRQNDFTANTTQLESQVDDSSSLTIVVDDSMDWDGSILQARTNSRRDNVIQDDKKLLELNKLYATLQSPASSTTLPQPKKKLKATVNEEKREEGLKATLNNTTLVPQEEKTKTKLTAPRKYITHTIVHIDLTNIKTIQDIEEALNRLQPDSTPYKDLELYTPLPPVAIIDKNSDGIVEPENPASTITVVTSEPEQTIISTTIVPSKEDQRKKREEEARRKKDEKEVEEKRKKDEKEAEEKRKKDEKEAEERRKKDEKEAEEKRKKDEKEAEEKRKKDEKEAEKHRKEEEKKRKEEEAKRKKEEKLKKQLKAIPSPALIIENESSIDLKGANSNNVSSVDDDNGRESSVSRNSISIQENRDTIRLAAASIDFHALDYPQPMSFEHASILLQDQQPAKIASKFQKANVFGTSGFRKPDHRTCYFFQYLWQTDFQPYNKVHQLLLNAVYMHINEKVIIPNHNADPTNINNQKSIKSEIPEPTGQQWVDVMRSSDAQHPAADLLGVTAHYTILRPLECDLKPSVMTLYIALYILDGCPDANYKSLVVALLRKFFQRDNAPKDMSWLEIFVPISYILNTLILSNAQVHSDPFYRMFYKYNLKKDLGNFFHSDDHSFDSFLHLCIEYLMLLPLIFWFRHLIQRYDYPTLCAAVRQRLLSNIKGEFERVPSEYTKGGYSTYITDVQHDNYLAQDLKVVFAEQKKQKHLLTPLEQQLLAVQSQKGPGRNSISYAPSNTSVEPETPKEIKIGPNIIVGKTLTSQERTMEPPILAHTVQMITTAHLQHQTGTSNGCNEPSNEQNNMADTAKDSPVAVLYTEQNNITESEQQTQQPQLDPRFYQSDRSDEDSDDEDTCRIVANFDSDSD